MRPKGIVLTQSKIYNNAYVLTAPDKNPENIKIQGHLPHQMDISWEVRETHNCIYSYP